ncbi:hypothetical protein AIOL_004651 [Candidatus Rhodobacter oscarellae]|uniref:Uncharacterized protein n=1 Tax=Candidatus Rhodobacter oscarellae TaxID=1675527 RepID=A0A0J9ED67_9RHOB|nr:hypothetical protein AIOL_004651 [Candidatus Rhodobacter lobularis]
MANTVWSSDPAATSRQSNKPNPEGTLANDMSPLVDCNVWMITIASPMGAHAAKLFI